MSGEAPSQGHRVMMRTLKSRDSFESQFVRVEVTPQRTFFAIVGGGGQSARLRVDEAA